MKKGALLMSVFFVATVLVAGCTNTNTVEQPIACTADAKICPDGTGVGRTGPDCEFAPCPAIIECDAENRCPDSFDCYVFEEFDTPICYAGDPCSSCGPKECVILESYPAQVRCG